MPDIMQVPLPDLGMLPPALDVLQSTGPATSAPQEATFQRETQGASSVGRVREKPEAAAATQNADGLLPALHGSAAVLDDRQGERAATVCRSSVCS